MKKLVILVATILCASLVYAEMGTDAALVTSRNPIEPPGAYNPAFGQVIRSWHMNIMNTGIAVHNDGYLTCGPWSPSLFPTNGFQVYTTTGSLVRTVSVTTTTNGYRGGSGKCHMGSGYFVTAQEGGGCYMYEYGAGGNPNGTGTSIGMGHGRGISWDGTYYYATVGDYSTPFGIYTTTGSQVGVVPGTVQNLGTYDFSTPGNGYLYVGTQNGAAPIVEVDITTGSVTRSFVPSAWGSGFDDAWNEPHLYVTHNTGQNLVVYDRSDVAVAPTSLGKVKSLYR